MSRLAVSRLLRGLSMAAGGAGCPRRLAPRLWLGWALFAVALLCVADSLIAPAAATRPRLAGVRIRASVVTGGRIGHTGGRSRGAGAPAGRLVFSDDFSGPAGAPPDDRRWVLETGGGGWGNEELEYYTSRPANAALNGHGQLAITARRESYTGSDGVTRGYTSARLQTKGRFEITYGRIEARIKLPAGQGLWPAFWALGGDIERVGWPAAGEIDVMESLGNDPFTVYGGIHGPQNGSPRGYSLSAWRTSPTSLASRYHVYAVEWSPAAIVFSLDGVPYCVRTPDSLSADQQWVFDKPFFLLLNLAVGGSWPGSPDGSSRFPATMLIDWVRVYAQ